MWLSPDTASSYVDIDRLNSHSLWDTQTMRQIPTASVTSAHLIHVQDEDASEDIGNRQI